MARKGMIPVRPESPFDWADILTTMAECYAWASPMAVSELTIFQVMMYLGKRKKFVKPPRSYPAKNWAEVKRIAKQRQEAIAKGE